MSSGPQEFPGRCNCGKFQFTAPPAQGVAACFCKNCTRAGGSLCSLNAVIPANSLKYTKGTDAELSIYEDKDTTSGNPLFRKFCGSCGSAIESLPKGGDVTYFKYSLLDDADNYAPKHPNMVLFAGAAPKWAKGDNNHDGTAGLKWPSTSASAYSVKM